MFKVGQIFLSSVSLVRCLSEPIAIADGQGGFRLAADKKRLKPNIFGAKNDSVIGRLPVFDGVSKLGYVDCINNDEGRRNSLWRLTDVTIDGSGSGDEHNVSGRCMTWARFHCTAIRIDSLGLPHKSGEVIEFSSAGFYTISDLRFIDQEKAA